jgi:cytochrome c-type biogenesis protein CcmH/NrfG
MTAKPIDELATYLDLMRAAQADKARAQAVIARCRDLIEEALGDNDEGTIGGEVAVTWRTVTSRRLNQTAIKTLIAPELLEPCWTETTTRQFRVIGDPA